MTVITGTDGSERAERAVTTAAGVALALGQPLVVVTVHREFGGETFGRLDEEQLMHPSEHAGAIANQSARRVVEEFPGLVAEGRAYAGKPAEGLLLAAADVDASLIVVGNRRVQGAGRVLGSIASEVTRQAPCDVYIAHTQE
ncbi:universal stress protein [Nocardioides sp.]|jgi:nucleotide-binding universal stress UspA family protein|uniref:universal stress protein n=1 Tax=Nocardioides sp. TaxID=35761 RepID=UPI00260728F8|nr:universal stress protein [Nocardioides sp.]